MASSKKWAFFISTIASFMYFFVIIFQIPLFRVPCRSGICTSPIEVTSSQLIATEVYPAFIVKALLYPGAIANAIINKKTIPSYRRLLNFYNFTYVKKAHATADLQRLEVLVGSYLSIAGAFFGLIRPARVSLFGTLLLIWGLLKEMFSSRNYANGIIPRRAVYINPTMFLAVVCAFLSIRKDVRKLIHSCKAKRVRKTLTIKTKTHLN
ncbi:hypothetical protein SLE2022_382120 [Rubroshorea leprosula]